MRASLVMSVVALLGLVAQEAAAQVYKYEKPDGTVVYTDRLSELPVERRRYYNERKRKAEEKRRELERRLGAEEVRRRELEEQKKKLEKAQLKEAEIAERRAEIEAAIAQIERDRRLRQAKKDEWATRMKNAKEKLAALLKEFRETQEAYGNLAVRADYTLLPGQGEQKADLRKKLEQLEKDIDAAIEEVEVTIPEEARKAGIPPGWIR